MGTSKRERVAIPPDPMRADDMLTTWSAFVAMVVTAERNVRVTGSTGYPKRCTTSMERLFQSQ
jgi:hypothetical protein